MGQGLGCHRLISNIRRGNRAAARRKGSKTMTDKETSNVIQLFPKPTDEEYENKIVPVLIRVLEMLDDDCRNGNYDLLISISESLIRYARRSLNTLDHVRKAGWFDHGRLPPITAFDVDNLAADCAIAVGGDVKMAEKLRNRSSVKRRG